MLDSLLSKVGLGDGFGLQITDNAVKVVKLSVEGDGYKIEAIGERPLTKNIVQNGVILEEKKLAGEITGLLSDHNISAKNCVVSIPGSQVYENIFYVPHTFEGKAFEKKVNQLVSERIPVDRHQIKYTYHVSSYSETNVVFVSSVKNIIIAQYYEVLKHFCGLKPVAFEPESLSLLRNIPLNFDIDEGVMVINMNPTHIKWFTSWSEDIFDSNDVPRTDFDSDPIEFIDDLKKSIQEFKNFTGRKITNAVVSGEPNDIKLAISIFKKELGIPVTAVDKYFVHSTQANLKGYEIASGLALKASDIKEIHTEINLFKDAHTIGEDEEESEDQDKD